MQKLVLLALFMLPFTYSTCSFDVEDNKRTVITGRLVDNAGNPVPNIPIISGIENYVLGVGESDASGYFEITSLESNENGFHIYINNSSDGTNDQYTQIRIENIADYPERSRDLYELGELELQQKAMLNLHITNTSGEDEGLFWMVEIVSGDCYYRYDDYNLIEQSSDCYETQTVNSVHPPEQGESQRGFNGVMGTTATFSYSIGNGPQETIMIELNQENNQYVFEY